MTFGSKFLCVTGPHYKNSYRVTLCYHTISCHHVFICLSYAGIVSKWVNTKHGNSAA